MDSLSNSCFQYLLTLVAKFASNEGLAFCHMAYFDQSLRGFLPRPGDPLCQSRQFHWPHFSLFLGLLFNFSGLAACFLLEDKVGLA